MKRFLLLIPLFILSISCDETIDMNDKIAIDEFNHVISKDYNVTLADVECYVNFKVLDAKNKGQELSVIDIFPILSEKGDTSLYVINYNEGWDVISADKRLPMVVATSTVGSFIYDLDDPQDIYFTQLKEDIESFKMACDLIQVETKSTGKSEQENVEFWDAITASNDFITSRMIDPNTPLDTIEFDLIIDGHWELMGVSSVKEQDHLVDHLTKTNWHQSSPFNVYCPIRTDENTNAPAGCVAIAGAQMLYYLCYEKGKTVSVPTLADFQGDVDDNVDSYTFSNFRSDHWGSMDLGQIAALVSYVGYLVEMDYGNINSSAKTSLLDDKVFLPLGITCSDINYDISILKDNLINNKPVIVSAYDNSIGHSFIVDGYQSYKTKYTYTYEWVYDSDISSDPVEYVNPRVEISYSSPYIENIKMNWGLYKYAYNNNATWYTPMESWRVMIDLGNGLEEVSFSNKKRMICNFQ